MLAIENINMSYGKVKVLKGVNLKIDKGEIVCIIGANGQGKTTLLNIISGVLIPKKGSVKINNVSRNENEKEYKKMLGYAPDDTRLLDYLTVNEYIRFFVSVYNASDKKENLKKYVNILKFDEERSKTVRALSKGNKKKLSVITSIVHEPKVLIMDEPIDGLDLDIQIEVIKLIKTLKAEMAVLIVTHSVSVINALADRVAFLHNGVIKEFDKYENLIKKYNVETIYDLYSKVIANE